MGRPLNKKYFQGGAGYTIGCNYHDGTSVVESVIVRQRSNTTYDVLGSTGTALANDYTSLNFADTNPDTIVRTGGTAFDVDPAAPAIGDFIRIESANTAANNGVYEIAGVSATTITLTADASLTADAADATATIEIVAASDVVRGKLVNGTPTALGEMQVVVTPEVTAATSARIINAHLVKCFDDNTYAWNPTAAGNFRGPDGAAGPQYEEATLQAASS